MDLASLGALGVAAIAAGSAYASQRSASRASVKNTDKTSRTAIETEAYVRARAFDLETIKRQDEELEELRADQLTCHELIDSLRRDQTNRDNEIIALKRRINDLERLLPQRWEQILRERLEDDD